MSADNALKNSEPKTKSSHRDRPTLCAEDWEHAALQLIADKGIRALTVESLARELGITKGSFYWHFQNREALLAQALERWESIDARNLTRSLSAIDDPRERLISFFRATSREKLTHAIYSSLNTAGDHPLVAPLLERTANRRIGHISKAYRELGFSENRARNRAQLAYSAYLGFLQLQRQTQAPVLSGEEFDAYVEHVIETLSPGKE